MRRLGVPCGAALMAITFFLPWDCYLSPYRQFLWALEAGTGEWLFPESCLLLGSAGLFLYSYLWAAFTGIAFFFRRPGLFRAAGLILHGAGLALAFALGLLFLIFDPGFLPRAVLLGVVAGAPLLFALTALASFRGGDRGPNLAAAGWMIIFAAAQVVLAAATAGEEEPWWGYAAGSAGAAWAAGSLFPARGAGKKGSACPESPA